MEILSLAAYCVLSFLLLAFVVSIGLLFNAKPFPDEDKTIVSKDFLDSLRKDSELLDSLRQNGLENTDVYFNTLEAIEDQRKEDMGRLYNHE